MVLVLVLAVLAWWLLDEQPGGPSTTSTAPAPTAPSCSRTDGMIGCQVGHDGRTTIGAGQLGPGESIPPERAIVTTYRRAHQVPPPPPPPGRPGPGKGPVSLW